MALFGKKKKTVTCALCGAEAKTGFFRGLFQREIEGQYVCDACYGIVDLPPGVESKMTLAQFKEYQAFRTENQKLKDVFRLTEEIDLGALDTKFYIDSINRMLCMRKDLSTTIFEGKHIKSFVIKEDHRIIFQGSAAGLTRYESIVPYHIENMAPQVRRYRLQLQRHQMLLDSASEERKEELRRNAPTMDFDEPFRNFNIEIHFEHPYWKIMTADMNAPTFSSTNPDISDYLYEYNTRYAKMEHLANALTAMAFPSQASMINPAPTVSAPAASVPETSADAISELKRYKELLDMEIITQEEFAAKKRQLLGL